MSVDQVSLPKPGFRSKRWVCPPAMRGLSGLVVATTGNAQSSYFIRGSGATCLGACGGQAAAGCWCDPSCHSFGDCCADKVVLCGGPPPPPPKCSCSLNCGLNGELCCPPSECPVVGL